MSMGIQGSASGKFELNAGGTVRAECIDALVGDDHDRLDAIAARAAGLKHLMLMLSFSDEMGAPAQEIFRMIGREADAIYALAIQTTDETKAMLAKMS